MLHLCIWTQFSPHVRLSPGKSHLICFHELAERQMFGERADSLDLSIEKRGRGSTSMVTNGQG